MSDLAPTPAPPEEGRALALLIARGASLEDACAQLGLSKKEGLAFTYAPWWRPTLKDYLVDRDWVQERMQSLIPAALDVKEAALRDEALDPALRLREASDLLDRTGHRALEPRERRIFVLPQELVEMALGAAREFATPVEARVEEETPE